MVVEKAMFIKQLFGKPNHWMIKNLICNSIFISFERNGFILKSLFDVNPRLEGVTIRGIPVRMLDELEGYLQENDIEIAALTLPKSKAEEVADVLVANGIKAIWNFAHTDLTLPKDVIVESVHLADSLMKLSYNISQHNEIQK